MLYTTDGNVALGDRVDAWERDLVPTIVLGLSLVIRRCRNGRTPNPPFEVHVFLFVLVSLNAGGPFRGTPLSVHR